jgi:chromate transport protein ChrA
VRPILARFLWVGLTAFGAARWVNLEAAFVRPGLIREQDFLRDLAIAQSLPGAGMVNLVALCGVRLGGIRVAIAAIALVLLPGLVAIVAALAWLSTGDPWLARLFHGILIGAIGVAAASLWRGSGRLRSGLAPFLATAAFLLIAAGLPMFFAVLGVGAVGVARYRWSAQTLP